MNRLSEETIAKINSALFFQYNRNEPRPEMKPWQYVLMEYDRTNLPAPARIPTLNSMEDAQIWMCLDERYNARLRMAELQSAYQSA